MRSFALSLILGLIATPSLAAGVGPQIAYVKSGTYSEIYLVDPDGTRLRQLYRSGRSLRIFALDMRPGGGELAFEEVASSGGNGTLKVIRYDNSGTRLATKSIPACRILFLDYHPDPSRSELLYGDSCGGTRVLNTATMASTPVAVAPGINKAVWRGGSEFIYNRSTPSASEILLAPVSSPAATTVVGEVRLASNMDLSTSGNLLLVDPVDFGELSLFNMTTGQEQKSWQIGQHGRFSPDGTQVVYVSGYDVRGSYVFIRKFDGSGSKVTLAAKGAFGPVDWRN